MNGRMVALCGVAALCATPIAATAQQIRLRSTTTTQYAELRPLRPDSQSGDSATRYVAGPKQSAAPLTQDLELSAWSFGMTGLRAYGLLRGRAALGSELVWPRSEDHFDALVAFFELERPAYRLRAGRQQRFSGLGMYGFDGLTATWRLRPTVRLEAYGGRGLARGFLEPLSSPDIRALDPFRPEHGAVLLGASVWVAPTAASIVSGVYQREILNDWSGIVSERAALDFQAGLGGKLYVQGSMDADIAGGALGKMRGAVMYRLPRRGFAELEAFRYRPAFDLTTIWGAFSPEGYDGVGASLRFGMLTNVAVDTRVNYRMYRAATSPFLETDDHATEVTAGLTWQPGALAVMGAYRLHDGFGGAQSGGDLSLAWQRPGAWRLALRGTAFQQVEDFRVSNGTVRGLGVEARGPLFARAFLRLSATRYWQDRTAGADAIDWSQTRALASFEWTFGADADRRTGVRP